MNKAQRKSLKEHIIASYGHGRLILHDGNPCAIDDEDGHPFRVYGEEEISAREEAAARKAYCYGVQAKLLPPEQFTSEGFARAFESYWQSQKSKEKL